jgi:hypothetical protein
MLGRANATLRGVKQITWQVRPGATEQLARHAGTKTAPFRGPVDLHSRGQAVGGTAMESLVEGWPPGSGGGFTPTNFEVGCRGLFGNVGGKREHVFPEYDTRRQANA